MSLRKCKTERAKENVRRKRRQYNKEYYGKTSFLYERRNWSADEEDMIIAHEKTDAEMSVILQRSVRAIQKHRHILKVKGEFNNED